mmetsp:Transcript_7835/g.17328  ORF Transcript_7835/g.17328 Transcript_7835/m.17328 type:complete len:319 (-) Transcript_7835:1335-2291(-)
MRFRRWPRMRRELSGGSEASARDATIPNHASMWALLVQARTSIRRTSPSTSIRCLRCAAWAASFSADVIWCTPSFSSTLVPAFFACFDALPRLLSSSDTAITISLCSSPSVCAMAAAAASMSAWAALMSGTRAGACGSAASGEVTNRVRDLRRAIVSATSESHVACNAPCASSSSDERALTRKRLRVFGSARHFECGPDRPVTVFALTFPSRSTVCSITVPTYTMVSRSCRATFGSSRKLPMSSALPFANSSSFAGLLTAAWFSTVMNDAKISFRLYCRCRLLIIAFSQGLKRESWTSTKTTMRSTSPPNRVVASIWS